MGWKTFHMITLLAIIMAECLVANKICIVLYLEYIQFKVMLFDFCTSSNSAIYLIIYVQSNSDGSNSSGPSMWIRPIHVFERYLAWQFSSWFMCTLCHHGQHVFYRPKLQSARDTRSLQCYSVLSDILVKNEFCIPLERGSTVLSTGGGFLPVSLKSLCVSVLSTKRQFRSVL